MAIKQIDNTWRQGDFLNFHDVGPVSVGSVTHLHTVSDRMSGNKLGSVRWFIQWRQYCFFPLNAVFDKKCLREVADFCELITNERRAAHKK